MVILLADDMSEPFKPSKFIYGLSKVIFRATSAWRMTVEGFDKIPKEPSIVLAKHRSHKEVLQLSYILHCRTGVIPLIIMKASLPAYLGWWGGVPMDRGNDTDKSKGEKDAQARHGLEYLANGIKKDHRSVIIFAEGTRKPTSMGAVKLGGVKLLYRSCERVGVTPRLCLAGVEHHRFSSTFRFAPMTYQSRSSLDEEIIREKMADLSGIDLYAQTVEERRAKN